MPEPGDLKLKERRTWKTWQLVVGLIVAAIVGMGLNYRTVGGASPSQSGTGSNAYTLPPPSGSTTTTAASGAQVTTTTSTAGDNATTTTAPSGSGSSTTTTLSSSPTPTRVVLGPMQSHGNWTSTPFATSGPGWYIGWAFQCTPIPAGGPSFQVFVTPVGGSPSGTPAVNETGGSGNGVTTQSTVGQQMLVVEAPTTCQWVVKVSE
jgi:hypothetical protein